MEGEFEFEFEFELPKLTIQRIQYFLTSKEAAQTTVLSKPWRSSWLTRPNLDFDQSGFGLRGHYEIESLLEFAGNTIKRYEESNSKIDSFRLCMDTLSASFSSHPRLTTELILRAFQIGATHLTIQFNTSDAVFPNEVFEHENLVSLTLKRCKMIDLGLNQTVMCARLRSLSLEEVDIQNPDMISRIISSCPLIEKLALSYFYPTRREDRDEDVVVLGTDSGLTNLQFHRLRSLVLVYVDFDVFLGDLSSKFPSLKELTLCLCSKEGQQDILVSSSSLEIIDFKFDSSSSSKDIVDKSQRVKFDVPRVRKFSFSGSVLPSMTFRSISREWESKVTITRFKRLIPLWFRKVSKFLTKLRRSRIHLFLHVHSEMVFDYKLGDIEGLPKRKIENLTIDYETLPSLSCYALFDGLFRICRPKLITQSLPMCSRGKANNFGFLGQRLLQGLNLRISTPSQFMYGLNDLKEVRAQIFDEAVSMWCDVPLDTLLDDTDDTHMKRFQLKWGHEAPPTEMATVGQQLN